ncbi:MAG: YggT family protein [candidate division NC10 bacterium]|nr:YggT family protein [candidate division NC10 bacterium]
MFLIANLLDAVAFILDKLLWLYMWVIIIRALISWVNPDPWNPLVQFLYRATEPVLQPIRRLLPMTFSLDISPVIAIFGIYFLQIFLVRSLYQLANLFR